MRNDDDLELSPEERAARDAVRGLGAPRPDAAFRERLKAEFTAGTIRDRAEVRELPQRRRFAPAWGLVAVAAAVAMVLLSVANGGPAWSVLPTTSSGTVTVDGVPFAVTDRADLESLLHDGARIETPADGTVTLMLPGTLALEVAENSAVTLIKQPGRWIGRGIAFDVPHGEARVVSGPRFHGHRLRATTPDAIVELVGTTVSVYTDSSGTCVCVLEGTASIGPNPSDMVPVPAGMRRVFDRATGETKVVTIAPPHAEGLEVFRKEALPALEATEE